MPHGLLAELTMHIGDYAAAVERARTALPVMQRIGASDDELQLRALTRLGEPAGRPGPRRSPGGVAGRRALRFC
jgi:hypothetical protein